MKIAVPVTNGNQINLHLRHSDSYDVYTVSERNEISEIKSIDAPEGCGCKSDIAEKLASSGVTIMLTGGIGNGAMNVFNDLGINVVRGCSGNATQVVRQYLSGMVKDSGSSCHHDEENHHHHLHHHEHGENQHGNELHHHHHEGHHHHDGNVCNCRHEDGHVCNH